MAVNMIEEFTTCSKREKGTWRRRAGFIIDDCHIQVKWITSNAQTEHDNLESWQHELKAQKAEKY
jgi:hypothetical protein